MLAQQVCRRRGDKLPGRVVEISGEPRYLGLQRGSMVVSDKETELGRIDLDNVLSIVLTSRGAMLTSALINETSERNIPIIVCNDKFHPVSLITPLIHHNDQHVRYEAQVIAKKGVNSKVWKWVVSSKVNNQFELLKIHHSSSSERLKRLSMEIKPGDPKNVEAQAAQVYWPALFGRDFRRDRNTDGINSLLNYGYTIIRSSMLRAILASGLHPTFGVFHKNKRNGLCLVDDLMEPYRPIVDQVVKQLELKGVTTLTAETKRCLASIVAADQVGFGSVSPMFRHMQQFSYDLSQLYQGQNIKFNPPKLLSELEVSAIVALC